MTTENAIADVVVDTREAAFSRAKEIAKENGQPVWVYVLETQVNQDGSMDGDAPEPKLKAAHRKEIEALLTVLRTTDDGKARNQAALALSDLRAPEAYEAIVALLRDPRTVGNRGTLLRALGPYDCTALLGMLIDFTIDGGYEVANEAMTLLDNIDTDLTEDNWNTYVYRVRTALKTATAERAPILRDVLALLNDEERCRASE